MPTLALAMSMLELERAVTERREQAAIRAAVRRRRAAAYGGGDAPPALVAGTVRATLPTSAGT